MNCGSNDLYKEDGFYICNYCGTKHSLTKDDNLVIDSTIDLNEDVRMLLEKWDNDPANAKRYVRLILQIDSHNRRALAELSRSSGSSSGGCYIATAVYGSYDCPEVWTLRRYRDHELAETASGRLFIHAYYALSPSLVRMFGEKRWFKRLWKYNLDKMVGRLNKRGVKDTPYQDEQW